MLKQYPADLGRTGGDSFRMYGGHRLWIAPEVMPRTYHPDNSPVQVSTHALGATFTAITESSSAIRKQLEITIDEHEPRATVRHRLRNEGPWEATLAPWALTVMAPGGQAILPLPPKGSHAQNLLPVSSLILWAYTDLSDQRYRFTPRALLISQDPQADLPQKIGMHLTRPVLGYALADQLFVKRARYAQGRDYPDRGSTVEVFTNAEMLELETLAPLTSLPPGDTVEHTEEWALLTLERPLESEGDLPQSFESFMLG